MQSTEILFQLRRALARTGSVVKETCALQPNLSGNGAEERENLWNHPSVLQNWVYSCQSTQTAQRTQYRHFFPGLPFLPCFSLWQSWCRPWVLWPVWASSNHISWFILSLFICWFFTFGAVTEKGVVFASGLHRFSLFSTVSGEVGLQSTSFFYDTACSCQCSSELGQDFSALDRHSALS